MADVDVVVIGSGAGGMAAAVGLANAGKSVAVFEQHDLPGGWCHSFDLEGFRFSPGVHYLGELQEGGSYRRLLEGLGVGGDLSFFELDPDGYDRLRVAGEELRVPKGGDAYRDRVMERFPRDAAAISTFFGHITDLHSALADRSLMRRPDLLWHGLRSLEKLLAPIQSPIARSILSLQGGDHGMPPSRCPAVLHAGLLGHYFQGAWTPKGGARSLPKAFIKQLRRNKGTIRVKTPVQRILVEGGRAIGVRLADGTEVRAHAVVSNADPGITFGRLMAPGDVPWALQRRLRRTTWSSACMSLFLAADVDPQELGLNSGNLWVLRGDDAEAMDRYTKLSDPLQAEVPGFFLTCTTAKDPGSRRDRLATFEVFTLLGPEAFGRWGHTAYGGRPESYEAYKEALADKVIDAVEETVPGLKERLVFRAVGTPLTNKHYCEATHGGMYGTEKRLGQLGPWAWPTAPMPGLFLCGASTISHGVAGAALSGVVAAARALGVRSRDVLGRGGEAVTLLQAESATTGSQKRAEAS